MNGPATAVPCGETPGVAECVAGIHARQGSRSRVNVLVLFTPSRHRLFHLQLSIPPRGRKLFRRGRSLSRDAAPGPGTALDRPCACRGRKRREKLPYAAASDREQSFRLWPVRRGRCLACVADARGARCHVKADRSPGGRRFALRRPGPTGRALTVLTAGRQGPASCIRGRAILVRQRIPVAGSILDRPADSSLNASLPDACAP